MYPGPLPFGERSEFANMTHEAIEGRIQGIWDRVTFNELKDKLPKILRDKVIGVRMNKLQTKIYDFIEQMLVDDFDEGADRWKLEEWKQARTVRILQAVTNPRLILDNDATFGVTKLPNKGKKNRAVIDAIKKMSKSRDSDSPKLKEACKIAENLATCSGKYKSKDGKKKNVIIYTIFVGNVDVIGSDDPNYPGLLLYSSKGVQLDPICITGNNPPKTEQREARINEFKNWNPEKEKCGKILVATLGSIAEAVSLHKNERDEAVCQHVIYLERNYNAGQFMQSKYRVYRIGSDKRKPIQYYYLKSLRNTSTGGTVNTIDEDIHVRVRDREQVMHKLLADRMHLVDPVSMEVETHTDKNGRKQPWGPGEAFDDIRARTIKRMKKKSK